jgi:hypothetical protein
MKNWSRFCEWRDSVAGLRCFSTAYDSYVGHSGLKSSSTLTRSVLNREIALTIAGAVSCSNYLAEHHGYSCATFTSPCFTALLCV